MIYWIIFFCLMFGSYLSIEKFLSKELEYQIYLSFVFVFFCMSFLRWDTGTDFKSYNLLFIGSLDGAVSGIEPGFAYFMYLVRNFSDSFTLFLFFSGAIIYVVKYPIIYKFSPNVLFSIFILYCVFQADIFFVRQNIAIAFCMLSVYYIQLKTPRLFIVYVLIACCFHLSAIIFLVAYKVYYYKPTFKKILMLMIGVFTFALVVSLGTDVLFSKLTSMGSYIFVRLATYFNSSTDSDAIGYNNRYKVIFMGSTTKLLLVYFVYSLRRFIKEFHQLVGFINLYLFGVLIFICASLISMPLGRIGFYFFPMEVVFVAGIFNSSLTLNNKRLIFIILSIYYATRLYATINGIYTYEYIPFKTIFS